MKFSVITVCFNSEKTIRRTFESVLKQSFNDYEYIVVDGASKDGTLDVIKEYEPKFEGRMRWISEPDKGLYDAMNKGIRMAQGEIIGIVNSDDWYETDALEKVALKSFTKADVYYGMVRNVDANEQEIGIIRNHHNFVESCGLHHPGCFATREIYDKYGSYSMQYRVFADYEWMLRLFRAGAVFCPVDDILTNFTLGGISSQTPGYEMFAIRYQYGITSKFWYYLEVMVEFFLKKVLKR